ncbi:hypothetical protein EJ06DRAFT_530762 [Trichodelitschia bisporula]|uniref:Uncharacterized protein n=1 Tax=Trichodelitschia bisporula TaxID=703511 RepID=A0A6G1HV95_9PEZI|nr:hypothetical protein EJ06DRAFT_530762 [Trichodelitschia bisporula]
MKPMQLTNAQQACSAPLTLPAQNPHPSSIVYNPSLAPPASSRCHPQPAQRGQHHD